MVSCEGFGAESTGGPKGVIGRKFGDGDRHEAEEMRGYGPVRAKVVLIIPKPSSLGKVGVLREGFHGCGEPFIAWDRIVVYLVYLLPEYGQQRHLKHQDM